MSKLEPTRTSSDLTATEHLRRMLDERGVEHYDGTESTLWGYEPTSESTGAYRYAADEIDRGRMQLRLYHVTPAQAIEATLGRGTCNDVALEGEWFECSACGCVRQLIHPHYCPSCGAEVVE